jgi:hypothetical protein
MEAAPGDALGGGIPGTMIVPAPARSGEPAKGGLPSKWNSGVDVMVRMR